jgi:peptidyl-prolyl cis-trans isomerase SurA
MRILLYSLLSVLILSIFTSKLTAQNQQQVTDRIVAIVNDRIILKSDVDSEILNFMRQSEMENRDIQFSEDLWYSALQSMVDSYVLLEKADIDSVVVSDELVNRSMDQRINQLIRQAGSEQALEEAFGQSLIQIRAEFREQFREQMIAQQVQQRKMSTINITRPEVEEFFNSIPEESMPIIPEQISLSQIVIIPQPLEDAKNEAYEKALALRDSVTTYGKDFEEMARLYSEDVSAPRGGLISMIPMDDLVSNYSAAAAALQPGGISEVVETRFGYHVIRLNERSGERIETNHILIKIDEDLVDEQAAIDKLNAIRDSVLHHDKNFSDMARKYSEDEDSSVFGGRILNPQTGRRLLQIDQLEPALYRIALLLDEEGQISEPRSYNPPDPNVSRAFRIVRLDRHIPEHVANLKDDFEQIREFALQRKRSEIMGKWIDDLREEIYVEFKIAMPKDIEPSELDDPINL